MGSAGRMLKKEFLDKNDFISLYASFMQFIRNSDW
jgi:hypothetical protein